jgi:hypothetical protein
MDVFDHPAVVAAIEQLDRDLAPLIAVTRGNAVAVVLGDDREERTVIIERRDGGWPPPQLIGGSSRSHEPRPAATDPAAPFVGVVWQGCGWPEADGRRPATAWHALGGIAADDVRAVRVTTGLDEVEIAVRDDGRFLALVRSAWGATPAVVVRTTAGEVMPVAL